MQSSYHLVDDDGNVVAMAFLTPDVTGIGGPLWNNKWIVNRICVVTGKEKGQGLGEKLLTILCEDADRVGATLWLGVSPDQPGYFKRLASWYARHGFKPLKRRLGYVNNIMVRVPDGH